MNILTDEEIKSTLDKVSCCLEDVDIAYSRAIEAAVMSKLAEQDMEPVAVVCRLMNCEVLDSTGLKQNWKDLPHGTKLYTETQYIAAQQRTAEACAKLAESEVAKQYKHINYGKPFMDHMHWEDIAKAIRNGDWREYL